MSPRDIFLAVLVVALWGINFVFIKLSVEVLPPLMANGLRFSLAVFPAIFFVKPPKSEWWVTVLFGLFLGVALYAFLNVALAIGMPAGLASLALQTQVLFTIILAFIWFKERPTRLQVGGGLVAVFGMSIIGYARFEGASLLPFLLTVVGAFMWGIANVLTKRAGKVDALSFTVWGCAIAPVPLFVLSYVFEGSAVITQGFANLDLRVWLLLIFQAYPVTLFGVAVWSDLLSRHSAASVTPFALLVPITGLLSGWLILGEQLSPLELFGSFFVVLGVGVTIVRFRKRGAEFTPHA